MKRRRVERIELPITIDPRPGLRALLPGREEFIGRIRFGDDLIYKAIRDAEIYAPEALPHLLSALTAVTNEVNRMWSER